MPRPWREYASGWGFRLSGRGYHRGYELRMELAVKDETEAIRARETRRQLRRSATVFHRRPSAPMHRTGPPIELASCS
jgi:hypothetical protein